MVKNREFDLSVATYGCTKQHDYTIAILPWGATEPHNSHLPYMTDCILSHDIAVESAKLALEKYGVRAMVLPPVPYGSQNPGQQELPFCISARYETQRAILEDIVRSLDLQGIHKILIINGHGGNSYKNMIRDLYLDYPQTFICSSEWFNGADKKGIFEEGGEHADELETSVMMHFHPEFVNLEEAGCGASTGFSARMLAEKRAWIPRNWSKVSKDTGIGNPMKSTAEKGAAFVAKVVDNYAEFLRDINDDNIYESDL